MLPYHRRECYRCASIYTGQRNSAFVFTLYQQLKKNSTGNLFYSPYSISTAIGMTYAEQPGTPKTDEQRAVLHFTAGSAPPGVQSTCARHASPDKMPRAQTARASV